MTLPKELIEDFKNNMMIVDLCKKYGLTYFIVRNGLQKLELIKEESWGGKRSNCGRKKIEKNNELEKIRKHNEETKSLTKQSGGNTVRPRFNVCRKYNNDYYMGGW